MSFLPPFTGLSLHIFPPSDTASTAPWHHGNLMLILLSVPFPTLHRGFLIVVLHTMLPLTWAIYPSIPHTLAPTSSWLVTQGFLSPIPVPPLLPHLVLHFPLITFFANSCTNHLYILFYIYAPSTTLTILSHLFGTTQFWQPKTSSTHIHQFVLSPML